MTVTRRVVLLALVLAVAALAGCELSLRAGQPCPCASGWICCADSQVCVREQTECAAYGDGGVQGDGPIGYADATASILAATGKYGLTDVAIDDTHVYWMESGMGTPQDYDARVMRVVKTGGTPEVVVTLAPRAYRFTLDATHVYVAHQNFSQGDGTGVGAIVRTPKAGGAPETVVGGLSYPFAIAVDETNVYVTAADAYQGLVQTVPKTGGTLTTLVDHVENPWDLALDRTFVYYAEMNAGRIMRVAKVGGPTAQQLASGWIGTGKLSLDESTVYFIACSTGPCESQAVYAVPKAGGEAARLVASRSSAGGDGDVVARSRLYWCGRAAGSNDEALGAIYAVPTSGGEPSLLAGGMQAPVDLVVEPDESAAYWVDVLTGDVGRLQLR